MHDATLKQIVRVAPGTIEELSEITGMGVRKVANYGADAAAYRRTTQRPVKALSGGMSARLLCGTVTARDRFDDQGPKDDATACQRAACRLLARADPRPQRSEHDFKQSEQSH